jgi:hypothetical protein
MVEIDAGLVEDNNFTRGNTRTDLARPPVAVLGKEHGSQMAQNAEGASSGIHPSLTDILIQEAARNGVEKLRENDTVRTGRFLFHTSAEWSGFPAHLFDLIASSLWDGVKSSTRPSFK